MGAIALVVEVAAVTHRDHLEAGVKDRSLAPFLLPGTLSSSTQTTSDSSDVPASLNYPSVVLCLIVSLQVALRPNFLK